MLPCTLKLTTRLLPPASSRAGSSRPYRSPSPMSVPDLQSRELSAPSSGELRARRKARAQRQRKPRTALEEAQRRAGRRVAFFGHVVVWAATLLLIAVAAPLFVAAIVGLSWGIGLAAHGYFAVLGPELKRRWVEAEVSTQVERSVTAERRQLGGKHHRSLEQLAASMAHEIRNPITAAKSLLQQVAEAPNAEENTEYVQIAVEELDRVERAVAHLLRYAREEPLRLEPVHAVDAIDSALELLRERVNTAGISVQRSIDPEVTLDADPDKLRRVVINLVSNGIDALVDSGFPDPTIEISAGCNLAGTEVWIRVRDNGPGIEPDLLDRIFDPFHTSKEKGTGLGLAITRKLAEAHAGRIEAQSELGAGASFVVTLPRYALEGPSRE